MGKQRLVCPRCGNAELWSDEPASILYPVYIDRKDDGEVEVEYGRSTYETMDEGTSYAGDIWCRSCGVQFKESDLITEAVYLHQEPNAVWVEESSDRSSEIRWAAMCECTWESAWFYVNAYVDEAEKRNADSPDDFIDPGQLAYEAAEAAGKEHLKQYGVDDDSLDAPSDEDAGHEPHRAPTGEVGVATD